jgi:hypothetical protein
MAHRQKLGVRFRNSTILRCRSNFPVCDPWGTPSVSVWCQTRLASVHVRRE